MKTMFASLILVCASYSHGQNPAAIDRPDGSAAQTVAGTSFVHFGKVDTGVYKGSKPRTDADFKFLQSLHIKYIVDLELLPSLVHSEQKKADRYGIRIVSMRINASPIAPSEKHVDPILAFVRDMRHQPIYFHCALGRDRTNLIAALYKMYFLRMSEEDAWQYMKESGYKDSWVRNGLRHYLEKHPNRPPTL